MVAVQGHQPPEAISYQRPGGRTSGSYQTTQTNTFFLLLFCRAAEEEMKKEKKKEFFPCVVAARYPSTRASSRAGS
jgi:hypothetical protein